MRKVKKALLKLVSAGTILFVPLILFTAGSVTAFADTNCPLWVGGEHVVVDGGGNWTDTTGKATYKGNAQSGTLTLNNYSYSGSGYSNGYKDAAIFCDSSMENLTIKLIGSSNVEMVGAYSENNTSALYTDAEYTVLTSPDGTGSLTLRDSTSHPGGGYSSGLCSDSLTNLTIGDCSLTAIAADGCYGSDGISSLRTLTINSGTVTATGGNGADNKRCWSHGIYSVSEVTINGGTVNANGGNVPYSDGNTIYGISCGIKAATTVNGEATVNARGGNAADHSYGIRSDGLDLVINGGSVTCSTGTSPDSTGVHLDEDSYLVINKGVKSFTSSGSTSALNPGRLKCSVFGTGWTDAAGTEGKSEITVNPTGTVINYKKIRFPVVKEMGVAVTGFSGAYDGKAHSISVTVLDPAKGAVIKYGEKEGIYNLDLPPQYTEPGLYRVYFEVRAVGYNTLTGDMVVEITDVPHTHTLIKHERVESTEDKEGNIEYWECTECGKLFSDEKGENEISKEDTIIPKKSGTDNDSQQSSEQITLSENKPMSVKVESVGGFQIEYPHQIPFPGKGKVTPEMFGDRFTVSQGNATYNVSKIKLNRKKMRMQITGLSGADKATVKAIKKATKGNNGLPVQFNPYFVRETDEVKVKTKKDGSVSSVKVPINGRLYKCNKNEWSHDRNTGILSFKGKNLSGSYRVK